MLNLIITQYKIKSSIFMKNLLKFYLKLWYNLYINRKDAARRVLANKNDGVDLYENLYMRKCQKREMEKKYNKR